MHLMSVNNNIFQKFHFSDCFSWRSRSQTYNNVHTDNRELIILCSSQRYVIIYRVETIVKKKKKWLLVTIKVFVYTFIVFVTDQYPIYSEEETQTDKRLCGLVLTVAPGEHTCLTLSSSDLVGNICQSYFPWALLFVFPLPPRKKKEIVLVERCIS